MPVCKPSGVETAILIQAPAEQVWNELVNFNAYPDWHPYLKSVNGKFKKGKFLHFMTVDTVKGEGKFTAKVLSLEINKSLEWGGSVPVFFKAKHYFHLVENADGSCLLVQGEYWKRLFGKSFGKKVYEEMCSKFDEMNLRLKARVEGN